jgi:hypothetical protein
MRLQRATRRIDVMHVGVASLVAIGALSVTLASGAASDVTPAPATLGFADFYKVPIGPRGLEPGRKLLALAGSRVELVGYVARRADPASGPAILAAVPVELGDEDEGLADDLPASVAYLHPLRDDLVVSLGACRGAMRVAGRLEIGPLSEPDGRTSFIRVLADSVQCAP